MHLVVSALIVVLIASTVLLGWLFRRSRTGASRWPTIETTIQRAEVICSSPRTREGLDTLSCWICKLYYTYSVAGREYAGDCKCVLPSEELAQKMADLQTGQLILIHYDSVYPQQSFVDHQSEVGLNRTANMLRLGAATEATNISSAAR